jgi:hypothetical protein
MANRMLGRVMLSPDNMLPRLYNIRTMCPGGWMVKFSRAHSPNGRSAFINVRLHLDAGTRNCYLGLGILVRPSETQDWNTSAPLLRDSELRTGCCSPCRIHAAAHQSCGEKTDS